jgi:hypothetical protein
MWNGIAIGIGRQRFAGNFVDSYSARVLANGGVIESLTCVANTSTLLQQASWLLIPSGYKEDVVYAQNPSNGNGDLTWTRASDAWRTYSDGTILRTPWNLSQFSEQFENAHFAKQNSSVISNIGLSPINTLTADKLVPNTTLAQHRIFNQVNFSGPGTLSVYAKADGYNFLSMGNSGGVSGGSIYFDLSNGTISGTAPGFTPSIQNIGNGWYRCSLYSNTMGAGINLSYWIIARETASLSDFVGDETKGILIWGNQINEGSILPYFPTTNRQDVPRLSYMYGSCPALLLEPQRTNLNLQSNDISNSGWAKINVSVTGNSTTSPDGGANASLISVGVDASALRHRNYYNISPSYTSGTTYTWSIYAKKNAHDWMQMLFQTTAFDIAAWANFDLNNGVVGNTGGAVVTARIQSVGNGWYRCSITSTATITATATTEVLAINNTNGGRYPSYQSLSAQDVYYLWGAQVEVGAYPTTLIVTTTATATRLADIFTRNNIYTNGLISASGGTWFVELKNNISYTRDGTMRLGIGDTSNLLTNSIYLIPSSVGRYVIVKTISNPTPNNTTLYTTTTDNVKAAIKWNGSTADVFVNGVKQVSATPFTTTAMEFLVNNAITVPTFIQQMALFNTPLSDSDCALITT